jgi:hypothetical protein
MQITHDECNCCGNEREVFTYLDTRSDTEFRESFSVCPSCIKGLLFGTMFQCLECKNVSSQIEWDNATKLVFGEDIVSIQHCDGGASFICPTCKVEIDRENIQ